jgi:5-methylcytosine-specific restriction enzyme B
MTLKEIISKLDIGEEWKNNYKRYVPKFINEAKNKLKWQDWDTDTFHEFFHRSSQQCVSSIKRGYFTNKEKQKIKDNWHTIAPLLKEIAESQEKPLFETYDKIKAIIRRFTDQDRKAATNRLIASLQPKLLCTIVEEGRATTLIHHLQSHIPNADITIHNNWFLDSHAILEFFKKHIPYKDSYDLITLPWQTYELLEDGIETENMNNKSLNTIIELLKYKKQIILQGPPGTGKTKLAKEIAAQMIPPLKSITEADINRYITAGISIPSPSQEKEYVVEFVDMVNKRVKLKRESETTGYTSYDSIRNAYETKLWKQKIEQNDARRAASLANYIFTQSENVETRKEFKLLQFHPSYSYEDFVRGIIAIPNEDGEGFRYEARNKTLGTFAKDALENFRNAQASHMSFKHDMLIKRNLERFIDHVQNEISDSEGGKYPLTEKVYIFEFDDKRFKYKGDNWATHEKGLNMKYSEIEKILAANVRETANIKKLEGLEALTQSHSGYYAKIVEKYDAFAKSQSATETEIPEEEQLKNYVLVIDEINRANLSSVLGELIYALEYRGEKVETMYSVEGSTEMVLPANLYLIGTMNSADRSVGHIDYALRRRFSFVDVAAENLVEQLGSDFHSELFQKVASLFNYETNLSREFSPQQVQLGHSYFIQQYEKDAHGKRILDKPYDFALRLEYEIKPILLEYVRDGILIGQKEGQSIEKYIQSLSV